MPLEPEADTREPLLRRLAHQQSSPGSAKGKAAEEAAPSFQSTAAKPARAAQTRRQWLYFVSGFVLSLSLCAVMARSRLEWTAGRPSDAFPDPGKIGHRGPTATGAEPFVVATAAAMPLLQHTYPVQVGSGNLTAETIFSNSGNLSPPRSVPSFGLPRASEKIPGHCSLDQVHILHRHGQRYPTSGSSTENLERKIKQAGNSFKARGAASFLNDWHYPLGSEILTPAGRLQLFQLGTSMRYKYGELLKRMNSLDHKPVFRTTSQDRMLHSALNFAAGFFGIPYEDQYNQEVIIEDAGFNNTLEASAMCPNDGAAVNRIGFQKAREWAGQRLTGTAKRLQSMIDGIEVTPEDALAMLYECSYETVSLGYSAFCPLFTEADFETYGYMFDLVFHYNYGWGSPVSSAIGIGWVEEVVSRLTKKHITESHSSVNSTLTSNPITFPLDQTIYVDASHDTSITAILVAMNFTSLGASGPLPADHIPHNLSWHTAEISPSTQYIRWLLNDGVLPLTGVRDCGEDEDGLCRLDTWIRGMQKRIETVDFAYDCSAEYEPSDQITNGRPPHKY